MSKPWQELLDLVAPIKNPNTRAEVVAGRLALLRHKMEDEQAAYKNMIDWGTFDLQVQGYAGSADGAMIFQLEEFMKLNDALVQSMDKWNIRGVKAAVIREGGGLKVKAITPMGNVEFLEPDGEFPTEELMTKLQMINPPGDE